MNRKRWPLAVGALLLLLLGGACGWLVERVVVPRAKAILAVAEPPARPQVLAQEEIIGIGTQLRWDDETGTPIITQVLPGSPALRAGLSAGQVILKIGNDSTDQLNLAGCVSRIRGPVNSKVRLEVFDPAANKTNVFELVRQKVQV